VVLSKTAVAEKALGSTAVIYKLYEGITTLKTVLFSHGSLALEALLIGVHCKKRYITV